MQLNLTTNRLTIELEWYEQLWAVTLERQMHIPLSRIDRATTEEPQSNWAEIRAPGTFLPGVIKAGTYYTKRGKEFWYVTSDRDYLTLELHDEPYRRIVITIPDNIVWAERIDRSLTELRSDRQIPIE
ncbi:hypothetical protein [Chamaesiphon minutus]|uniref:Bacterial Pleckstrin homology domain-containing protein n=1 Tax=Chamaesiphon minutus (strain ATCC 27169 / PCC 6605) TaxID=1173020 RepID=K9UD36_CHAP6|nr:hypothetical protein [Chamaesiphon minutus]AFY92321.1 hypothetical protein Cha6605_1090 [Chamaesiphon minutus PCC 6605]